MCRRAGRCNKEVVVINRCVGGEADVLRERQETGVLGKGVTGKRCVAEHAGVLRGGVT